MYTIFGLAEQFEGPGAAEKMEILSQFLLKDSPEILHKLFLKEYQGRQVDLEMLGGNDKVSAALDFIGNPVSYIQRALEVLPLGTKSQESVKLVRQLLNNLANPDNFGFKLEEQWLGRQKTTMLTALPKRQLRG